MSSRRSSYFLFFLVIVFLELSLLAYLVVNKRMVLGHDGFELFTQQWYFVNSKVVHGQIPLWTPYMTHGNPTWWYFIYSRIDIFTNVLMLFSSWIKNTHFLPLFYGSLFFNKFILLAGVWLLAKRYFSSPLTVFFVASTVTASTITMTQNSFPLVLCYGLPLIIYLLHRFFDTWSWKWLFFAIYFYCVISINTFYFFPIISLAIFLYFFVYYIGSFPVLFKAFKFNREDVIWVLLISILLVVFYFILSFAKDSLMYINAPDRLANGQVTLTTFVNYGGQISYAKWMELLVGISPNRDYTLYMGVLSLPLIFLGVFLSKNSKKWPLIVGAVFLLMFSQSTIISILAYYGWPLMKFYRHIGYISPLIKLYLCFLAGFGFEQLFDQQKTEGPKAVFIKSLFAGFFLLLVVIFLDYLALKPRSIFFLLEEFCQSNQSIYLRFSPYHFSAMVMHTAFFMLIGSLIFFLRAFVQFSERASLLMIIVLLFHLFNMYDYAFEQIQLRSFPLTKSEYNLTKFNKIPFRDHRVLRHDYSDPREALVYSLKGIKLDSFNDFTYTDLVKPLYVSDISLRSFQRIRWGLKNNEEKLQFFTGARSSFLKTDPQSMDLSQNQRIMIPYKVTSFSPNEIVVNVNTQDHKGVWLEYADLWHPFWKAQINGHPTDLYIGNWAYKALPLGQGMNIVRFYIEYKPLTLFYDFFMYSSFIWMVLVVCLLVF